MALDWVEQDNFRRTTQEVLIIALKERGIDFSQLDAIVQITLLEEALRSGVQHSLDELVRLKDTLKATNNGKCFQEAVLKEIYRERGKMLPKKVDA